MGVEMSKFTGSVAVLALIATASSAFAGGFAIREQSAESQGASFAGNAAGNGLSVMYWNPAGAANKTSGGIHNEANFAAIVPRATVTVDSISGPASGPTAPFFAGSPNSSEIGHDAIVPASYASYKLAPNMYLGVSINSGFGLATEPKTLNYDASVLGRRSQLFTTGATPTLAYVVSPLLTIGAGAQINYAKGRFKFATGVPQAASTSFEGDDFAFGATAGIMLTPAAGTKIGLGWRSRLTHELEGDFVNPGFSTLRIPAVAYKGTAEVKLPDIVTLSIRQDISSTTRLMGTVEWSNWSRFNELRVKDTTGKNADLIIDANWSNSTFFSLGGEYDYSKMLTMRAGVAYEYSPINDPKKRLVGVPDSNRIWASFGGTYNMTEATSLDLAYTHVFLEDSTFERNNTANSLTLKGTIEASTDILSVGVKTKF
jgi:long-chain fatty acid transport protein